MSLEKDVEELSLIVQEIKAKEAEVLALKAKLEARAQKMGYGVKPAGDVAVTTHKRGRPRKSTANIVRIVRTDTGEIIEDRGLLNDERQMILEVARDSALETLEQAAKDAAEEKPPTEGSV